MNDSILPTAAVSAPTELDIGQYIYEFLISINKFLLLNFYSPTSNLSMNFHLNKVGFYYFNSKWKILTDIGRKLLGLYPVGIPELAG